MDRRTFVVTVAGMLLSTIDGRCEQPSTRHHIAFLGLEPTPPLIEAFRQGLRDLNYVEGQNIVIEWRFSKDPARYDDFATEMIRLKVDVIVTAGIPTYAARSATKTIPIVFAGLSDPIRSGLVTSLAHPGGNITGVPYLGANLAPKRLQLLKEAVPKMRRAGVLLQPNDHLGRQYDLTLRTELDEAARSLAVSVTVIEIHDTSEFENAFARLDREKIEGLLVVNNSIFYSGRRRIAELAASQRLPVLYDLREYVDAGGLMSYAPGLEESFRRVATYVDKILKGTKPGDLPIEQPTKFDLVINLKTAKALGLTIPPSLLLRADQLIE